jgi:hypothetical protein
MNQGPPEYEGVGYYDYCVELTARSAVFVEKLTAIKLSTKFPAFYGTR